MSMAKIGLKLANGEFYPVLEDGAPARKRLVVTTVQDGQRSVQIDLYRGGGKTVHDAVYIGSIVIEEIPVSPHGEPDIRLEFSLDAEGNLAATAEETATGERRSLNVSLEALDEEKKYEVPDFEFEEDTDSLPLEATALHDTAAWEEPEAEATPKGRGLRIALVAAGILLLALVAAFLVWYFAVRDRGGMGIGAAAAATAPAPKAVTTTTSLAPATTGTLAAAVTTTLAPKVAAAVPAPKAAATPIPKTAVTTSYRLRWGDTLWDLAYSYYSNPWLYPKIAKANGIRNPDRIIAGTRIQIPPR